MKFSKFYFLTFFISSSKLFFSKTQKLKFQLTRRFFHFWLICRFCVKMQKKLKKTIFTVVAAKIIFSKFPFFMKIASTIKFLTKRRQKCDFGWNLLESCIFQQKSVNLYFLQANFFFLTPDGRIFNFCDKLFSVIKNF